MVEMHEKMPPLHPGELLLEEFLQPMGISQNQLALAIRVSVQCVDEIVHGRRRITADMALRLSRFFSMSANFWLGLQQDYDLDVAIDEVGEQIERDVFVYAAD